MKLGYKNSCLYWQCSETNCLLISFSWLVRWTLTGYWKNHSSISSSNLTKLVDNTAYNSFDTEQKTNILQLIFGGQIDLALQLLQL